MAPIAWTEAQARQVMQQMERPEGKFRAPAEHGLAEVSEVMGEQGGNQAQAENSVGEEGSPRAC